MAAFKFFNIGKANEEITRLEAQVADLTAERDALRENDSTVATAAEKLQSDLAAANGKIVQLEADLVAVKASLASTGAEKEKLTKDLADATKVIANPSEAIKNAASAQAAAITMGIGVPPVSATPNANPAGGTEAKSYAEKAILAAQAKAQKRDTH